MSEKNKTIEDKMNELRAMVAWFESEEFSLTQATERFEQASKLAREIEHELGEIKNTVNVLKRSFEDA